MHDGRWEQRWHPLREEWVVVAAHRQDRPWTGETVGGASGSDVPRYDPDCYLCPGNERSSGERNLAYRSTFVFDNDHPCVSPDAPPEPRVPPPPYRVFPARGVARVVCFSPRHDLTLAEMAPGAIEEVIGTWQREFRELGSRPEVNHVLMFENKGKTVGVSNPHPHGQIYATHFVFKTIESEVGASERYHRDTGRVLFRDILAAESKDGRRILFENENAVAFLPYFARYPYEIFVAPKKSHPSIATLSDEEVVDFSKAMKSTLVRLDNLWRMSFPYVMPLHQAPTDGADHRSFHFHIEIHPPLRKPDLLKYLAGPEIGGGNFLSDTVPEEKAAELRALDDVHYKGESR